MKKLLATLILVVSFCPAPVGAMTLSGSVEKSAVLERHDSVEGRIGIRVSHFGNVGYVHPGSPAEEAGLRKGDTITRVDGSKHSIDYISGQPGTNVRLEVRRGFSHFAVDVRRVDYRTIQP